MSSRKVSYLLVIFIFVLFGVQMAGVSPVHADLWQLNAQTRFPSSGYTDFWATFDDADNDGLIALGDLLDFSGVGLGGGEWYTTLSGFPTATLTMPGTSGGAVSIPLYTYWIFTRTTYPYSVSVGAGTGDMYISYTATNLGPSPSVPLPAAVWLFGTGLLAAVGIRRKRSRK